MTRFIAPLLPSIMSVYPKTRAEAKRIGSLYYNTGKPCVNGHDSNRITGSGHCQGCNVMRTYQRLEKPEYRAKAQAYKREYMRKRLSDPEDRACIRQQQREASRAPHRLKAKAEYDASRPKEKRQATERRWRVANPEAVREKTQKRHRLKLLATPLWVDRQHKRRIGQFYAEAMRLARETGLSYHVDHMVPLLHPRVCGLHVWWNLQVLTEAQNIAKHNAFNEDAGYDPRATGRCQG